MKEDSPILITISGAALAVGGALFLLIVSIYLDSTELMMLTRILALSSTLVPILGLGIPDLIKLDVSTLDSDLIARLLRKYGIYLTRSVFMTIFCLYLLYVAGLLGIFQDKSILMISVFISISTVMYNILSSLFISKLNYISDLKISLTNSSLKIILPIVILSHSQSNSNWVAASILWGISPLLASLFGLPSLVRLFSNSQDLPQSQPKYSPLSLGIVSSFVNSRIRFLSFTIPLLTVNMLPEDQALAYILWTVFVGTLFIPNALSADLLIRMKRNIKISLSEYFSRACLFSAVLALPIYEYLSLLSVDTTVEITPIFVIPWACLNVLILYEFVTKVRMQALDMKRNLVISSLATIIFISASMYHSQTLANIGSHLFVGLLLLTLIHHVYNVSYLLPELREQGFD